MPELASINCFMSDVKIYFRNYFLCAHEDLFSMIEYTIVCTLHEIHKIKLVKEKDFQTSFEKSHWEIQRIFFLNGMVT